MSQVLNNEVDILNVANIDNDIRDSFTRAMIAGEEKETYCTRQGGYDINEFFIWTDRQIYKTKAVIAQGDTFILNTNIVLAGTLSDQMYQLFAQSPESIREVISNIEEGSTATKNYHAGEYFIWNDGFLYKVTAATINIGTAFVVDTNVVKCNNVTDELSSLNEALTNKTNGIISTMSANGAHNLLPNTLKNQVKNGVTYTVNSNGSIYANGTATADSIVHVGNNITLDVGTYILTGAISKNRELILASDGQPNKWDEGSGLTFTVDSKTSFDVYIYIKNGFTVNDTFYPMIRCSSDKDQTYTPYALTNRELTTSMNNKSLIPIITGRPESATFSISKGWYHKGTISLHAEFTPVRAITSLAQIGSIIDPLYYPGCPAFGLIIDNKYAVKGYVYINETNGDVDVLYGSNLEANKKYLLSVTYNCMD